MTQTRFSTSPLLLGVLLIIALAGFLAMVTFASGMSQIAVVMSSALFIVAVLLHTVINWKEFT